MLSWWKEKPQAAALLNGALAGLAGITPASGYVNSPASIFLGVVFGLASFGGVHVMKHHWHVDDALDVSSVHGLTGVLGSLGLGLFAQLRMDPLGANGAFYGHPMQLLYQFCGVLLAIGWAGFWTIILLRLLDHFQSGGIRCGEDEEEVGLDWAEHHEIAYHKLHVLEDPTIDPDRPLYANAHAMEQAEELAHALHGGGGHHGAGHRSTGSSCQYFSCNLCALSSALVGCLLDSMLTFPLSLFCVFFCLSPLQPFWSAPYWTVP